MIAGIRARRKVCARAGLEPAPAAPESPSFTLSLDTSPFRGQDEVMTATALAPTPATEVRDTVPVVREYLETMHALDDDSDGFRDLQEALVQVAFECRRTLGVPRPVTLGWSVHEWTAAALYLMRVQAADLFDRDVFITYCGEPDGPMPADMRAAELDAALNDCIDSICAQIVGLR